MTSKHLTLESEINNFANNLPYWAKYIAQKILSGNAISLNDIDTSYSCLLEELKLKNETEKPVITINYNAGNSGNHKLDLLLSRLESVEGVNALTENQTIEFSPNLTIIYGANGSGKSGYVRLLKKVFYSKAPEEILPNVHINSGHKSIKAKFTFISQNSDIPLEYPANENSVEFEQFSVFDGKGLLKQLENKNEFEFRPAGLSFFAEYTDAITKIEQKLNANISDKRIGHTLDSLLFLFDGESEIKTAIEKLSASTKIEDLKKYTPFSEEDKTKKAEIQKQYDELLLASRSKDKEIKDLENIKKLLGENKKALETLNRYFSTETLEKVKKVINDCKKKEDVAKAEGIENFKTDKIEGIGTEEWKDFIVSAEAFAINQKFEKAIYPENGDNCLFCHQPLSEDAEKLIASYWTFIKSVAEENAKKAQEELDKIRQAFEKLVFELFPIENTLSAWLTEKYPQHLNSLKQRLTEQKTLSESIISDIQNKTANNRIEVKISVEEHTTIETALGDAIKLFKDDEQSNKLEKLLKEKTFLEHKEKFNTHFSKFEAFVDNQIWIKKAGSANFAKRKITDTEKALSDKYFNQKYVETFNEECQKLNGNFGIEINHTGTAGRSYRQLKLRGNNPNAVLSEGEQKVIAIADFIAEMQLSEVNRGIIFDDPVTSLDDARKAEIARRLIAESSAKQVIVFSHDLVFVSNLLSKSKEDEVLCHWIESRNNKPGFIWFGNAPIYQKKYRNAEPAKNYFRNSNKDDCPPEERYRYLAQGFSALRTSYEVLVIYDLFNNTVRPFEDRVSIDSLSEVNFDQILIQELQDSFAQCCRYMEGHTHSDKYAYKNPEPQNLNDEIMRFEEIRKKIRKFSTL
ncbi:AAA family ATPase [Nitrosomonas sp.]|uniref:AAA family ATPase n=1 Tax=Nitrosomonas sp. TaxID=42353 RepID=UPI0025E7196F|nr:AAA family ATPase [Nitrosomonas sp.]